MIGFANRHPAFLFVYFLSVILVTVFLFNPVFQCASLAGGLLFLFAAKGVKKSLRDLFFCLTVLAVITLTNPLFSHNGATPLFFMNGKAITTEAIFYGAGLGASVAAVIIWFKCMNLVMTSDKLLYLFGKTVPKLALIISMSLRFIPEYVRMSKKVSRAQKATGIYSSESYGDRIKSAARVFASTASWSLENSVDTSISMKARGYGIKGRTNYFPFRFMKTDVVLTALSVLLAALTVAGDVSGDTLFYYYPKVSAIRLTPFSLISYISFSFLALLPFIAEVKGAVVWKYCVSKT